MQLLFSFKANKVKILRNNNTQCSLSLLFAYIIIASLRTVEARGIFKRLASSQCLMEANFLSVKVTLFQRQLGNNIGKQSPMLEIYIFWKKFLILLKYLYTTYISKYVLTCCVRRGVNMNNWIVEAWVFTEATPTRDYGIRCSTK